MSIILNKTGERPSGRSRPDHLKIHVGKRPCGFCQTDDHDICPEILSNGWVCPCFRRDHGSNVATGKRKVNADGR